MMSVEKILSNLDIKNVGHYEKDGKKYVIELDTSDEFSKLYSKLDNAGLDEIGDENLVSETLWLLVYKYDDYYLKLIANSEKDSYKLVVTTEEDTEEIKEWKER